MTTSERAAGLPLSTGRVQVLDVPTVGLVRKMTDGDVVAAVSSSLGLSLKEDPGAFKIMTRHINGENARRYIPPWFNLRGLVQLVHQATAIGNLREPLLTTSDVERQAILQFLKKTNLDEGVTELKEANERVAGTAINHALLGALVGGDIGKVINRHETIKTPDQMVFYKPTIAYAVAVEIGNRFVTPAASPEDFIDRVQLLVPDLEDELHNPGNTLQEYLIKHNAFDTTNSQGKVTCPAIHKTGVMLRTLGHVLATDNDFRQRALAAVKN